MRGARRLDPPAVEPQIQLIHHNPPTTTIARADRNPLSAARSSTDVLSVG
ncbi:hypothetical protein ACTPOE_06755 [Castellaniella sp. WN]